MASLTSSARALRIKVALRNCGRELALSEVEGVPAPPQYRILSLAFPYDLECGGVAQVARARVS